jgi:hypothetical protein
MLTVSCGRSAGARLLRLIVSMVASFDSRRAIVGVLAIAIAASLLPTIAYAQRSEPVGIQRTLPSASYLAADPLVESAKGSAGRHAAIGAGIGAAVGSVVSLIIISRAGNTENFYGPIIYLVPPALGAAGGALIGLIVWSG